MSPHRFAPCAALVALLTLAAGAETQEPARIDGKAREILEGTADVYRKMPAYADAGSLSVAVVGVKPAPDPVPLSLVYVRPAKLILHSGNLIVVSDEKSLRFVNVAEKTFRQYKFAGKLPELVTGALGTAKSEREFNAKLAKGLKEIQNAPSGPNAVPGSLTALPVFVIATLLLDKDPVTTLRRMSRAVDREEDRRIEGRTARVVRMTLADGNALRLFIDAEDRRVKRIELAFSKEANAKLVAGLEGATRVEVVWKAERKEERIETAPRKVNDIFERRLGNVKESTAGYKMIAEGASDVLPRRTLILPPPPPGDSLYDDLMRFLRRWFGKKKSG